MSAWKHWPPRSGEPIRNTARTELGLRDDGVILMVDRENEEVLVKWHARKVVRVLDVFEWQGHTCTTFHYVIDGVWWHRNIDLTCHNWLRACAGGVDSFSFDDLQGCWSTTDGGEGCWLI